MPATWGTVRDALTTRAAVLALAALAVTAWIAVLVDDGGRVRVDERRVGRVRDWSGEIAASVERSQAEHSAAALAQERPDGSRGAVGRRGSRSALAASVPVSGEGGWQTSKASWYGPGLYGNGMACPGAGRLTPDTIGVAHRSLPCGTRVVFRVNGREATAPVVDRGPFVRGRTWDLTHGLCRMLDACHTGQVEWRLL